MLHQRLIPTLEKMTATTRFVVALLLVGLIAAIDALTGANRARTRVTGAPTTWASRGLGIQRGHGVHRAGAQGRRLDGQRDHQRNATAADLAPLFRSAALAISAAAILLGTEAERFWRGGKCVEVLVDPQGGDVEPDSVTDVIATVRHKFEETDLDKPLEATLVGVKAVDPAGAKQPAPATVKFTAGSQDGDTGELTFQDRVQPRDRREDRAIHRPPRGVAGDLPGDGHRELRHRPEHVHGRHH